MATTILTNRDFNQKEIQNARIQNLAAAPSNPVVGQIYFDTTLAKLRVCTNATGPVWVNADGSDIPDNTITSAKINDGAILNADINGSAGIVLSKLAVDPLARANHTGTQTATTVSDFHTAVRTSRLDQMAAPGADISMAGFSLTGLREPSAAQEPATKNYVDLARAGIRLKDSVRVKTTAQMTLSGLTSTDGITPIDGDRILVANQTDSSQNGIYIAHPGAWTRATDADTFGELQDGATVWVNEGTQQNTTWAQINTLVSLASTQVWSQQGAAAVYIAGNGIDLTGQTFDVVPGNGILADGTSTRVDPAVVARKFTATLGDGVATSYVVNHALGNQWLTSAVVCRNSAPFDLVECDIQLTDVNNVTVIFTVAPTTNQYRINGAG